MEYILQVCAQGLELHVCEDGSETQGPFFDSVACGPLTNTGNWADDVGHCSLRLIEYDKEKAHNDCLFGRFLLYLYCSYVHPSIDPTPAPTQF